ncbi:hypothetical protein MML48_5g00008530 [Holotrichia oblita]|uniref:Uncharacterized protein n=1 Tax=Holotrichia oblita TaxID=644536 RepID=A0ACB9T1Q6_HOLOL|nr:hypothetical protein MML48_5g00008530 [Holotrichia oblita]
MQDTEVVSPKPQNMSPYLPSKYESPCSSRSQSPCLLENQTSINDDSKYMSDDEISVGCPSPALNSPHTNSPSYSNAPDNCRCPESDMEDYFKPLKRLKMVNIDMERRISPTVEIEDRSIGVKSFSIMDILNHRPSKTQTNKIVRPWDLDPEIEAQQSLERFHRHLKAQQLALLRPDFANFSASYTSETGSDRSSSVASDCCSPDIVPSTVQRHQRQNQNQKQPGGTPLDALFQMTSKTFDSTTGETSSG